METVCLQPSVYVQFFVGSNDVPSCEISLEVELDIFSCSLLCFKLYGFSVSVCVRQVEHVLQGTLGQRVFEDLLRVIERTRFLGSSHLLDVNPIGHVILLHHVETGRISLEHELDLTVKWL